MSKTITLKTLPEATAQEVFDQVARHLLTQMETSLDLNGGCAYRGERGLMCAAGCLISNKEYTEDFEGVGWEQSVTDGRFPKQHCSLINKLQSIHDCEAHDEWLDSLRELAVYENLSADVLKEFSDE